MNSIAIICPGQGAQSANLLSSLPFTRRGNKVCEQVLQDGGISDPELVDWLAKPESAPGKCFQNRYAQPFICLYHAMIWAELSPLLPKPAMVVGYSLGELSACHCAGALDAPTLLSLAAGRACCMDQANPFSGACMVAVTGIPSPALTAVCTHFGAYPAIVFSDKHQVLGCHSEHTETLVSALTQKGASEVRILDVSVPSHTPFLDSAVGPFRSLLNQAPVSKPAASLLSASDASRLLSREQIVEKVPAQINSPLRWDLVMARIHSSAPKAILELGPGSQLSKAFLREHPSVETRAVSEFRSFEGIVRWVERL